MRTVLRRRRDLNPRGAVNALHPFQGCPFGQLGYFSKSGEDGIRTHVALPPNGFQDRLVMTASIPLHLRIAVYVARRKYYQNYLSVSTKNFIPAECYCPALSCSSLAFAASKPSVLSFCNTTRTVSHIIWKSSRRL